MNKITIESEGFNLNHCREFYIEHKYCPYLIRFLSTINDNHDYFKLCEISDEMNSIPGDIDEEMLRLAVKTWGHRLKMMVGREISAGNSPNYEDKQICEQKDA